MYRHALPMLGRELFLTDGGLETTLVFHDGLELPAFAAFPLVETALGRERLRTYFRIYAQIAIRAGTGFVLESPTWRANASWGGRLGYTRADLELVNRSAIGLLEELREEIAPHVGACVVSGCIGPRGDGYAPGEAMSIEEAERFHAPQVETLAGTTADLVTAMTLTHVEEAAGVARAAEKAGIPCAISFTVETDGRLPSGESLGAAIERVDAATGSPPAYYMVNCAHPTHFEDVLEEGAAWTGRLWGLRANASCLSHEELDRATELDDGDPDALGAQYAALLERLPHLTLLGGCCGTDHRHVQAVARACRPVLVASGRVAGGRAPRAASG